MAITKLTVENFKSFGKIELDLRPLNFFVGPNAAGKSNIIEALQFLKHVMVNRLDTALAAHGGADTLRNLSADEGSCLRMRIETDDGRRQLVQHDATSAFGIRGDRTCYEISIQFDDSDAGFIIVKDNLAEPFTVVELDHADGGDPTASSWWLPARLAPRVEGPGQYVEGNSLGRGRFTMVREHGEIKIRFDLPQDAPFDGKDVSILHENSIFPSWEQQALIEVGIREIISPGALYSLDNLAVYDFDPSQLRKAVSPVGPSTLDVDGGNLAVVLREIIRRPESKRKLVALVSALLPFVQDVGVAEFGFGQLITRLTETHSEHRHDLLATVASDGTVSMLALIVALYFQSSSVAVFEEPDRSIHPHLIGLVAQMMNEVTETKQIIVTTHNPELLRHAALEDILLVTRGPDGNSTVIRPADSDVIKVFLENELGIEDLFTQNLLAI